ncbi:MAG: histidine triad nucleotide-binding protein [bacterium]|nr:histidine triad nucleotide-binding protein [bacterium]
MECLFCKIVDGSIPSKKVFETENVLAFEDIDPQAPFHVIVIPKTHIASAAEINRQNSAVMSEIFEVIAKIAEENQLQDGFRVVNNCGVDGGQTVEHIHFHLMGRRRFGWPAG